MSTDTIGRFNFDGAEGIAFWVGDSDAEPVAKVMLDELPDLVRFLLSNFPGLSITSIPLIVSDSVDPKTGRKMYEICDSCNYERHMCPACGESLSHSEHDSAGNHHTAMFCRPDLFPHEPGDTCTRPRKPELMAIPGYEPWCYFDHERDGK